jgi:TetR/AcrR family tetracycline transcriptional repressor
VTATTDSPRSTRTPLSRERVLAEALALVDQDGLPALTMRALASRLGVEAMSLYNHVPNKQALLDGIRGLLWDEIGETLDDQGDWQQSMGSTARGLRAIARRHPQAFPLILSATTLDRRMLETLAGGLGTLDRAGFDRGTAANTLNAVVHYALGYAMMEISLRTALPRTDDEPDGLAQIVQLARSLPPEAPTELVRVARDCCACDLDVQFEFGLEALLAGLDPGCGTHTAPTAR